MKDHYYQASNITLHYTDSETNKPALILLHGLTANAHAFDKVTEGLHEHFRIICPDFRGNGLSDKPDTNYTVEDHATDIVALISQLELGPVYLAGHSFGGYLAVYIAAYYPKLVSKLIILDAAVSMNPNAAKMLANAISRLDAVYSGFEEYLEHVKKAPYLNFWDTAMLSYYRADVHDLPDGTVKPRSQLTSITEKSMGLGRVKWAEVFPNITKPALLVNATGNYTLGEPLLPQEIAQSTVKSMPDARYAAVEGNHLTMLYRKGAERIAELTIEFLVG